jgi:ribosomal protein L40E
MDVRDFIQAVSGALILRPDNILVASALSRGAFLSGYFAGAQPGDPTIGALSIAHVFLLVAGLGLLIGIGLTSSIAIGFFVVIGVAGGLFAIGSVLNVLGPQLSGAAASVQTELASLVVQPYVADAYLLAPIVVFVVGFYRWDVTTKVKKRKAVQETHLSLRQYCIYCGARHEPAATRCGSCGKPISAGSGTFCTDCGRPISRKALYCGYCGAEIIQGEDAKCQTCGKPASASSRFCHSCGARMKSSTQAEGGAPPSPPEPPSAAPPTTPPPASPPA